jgi:hypothetical protein
MKIDHIQLACAAGEEGKARAYFGELLKMEEKPESLRGCGGCWFRKGEAIVHLGVEGEFVPQKKAHPAFVVEALGARLETAGYPVSWDETLPGRRRFYTEDPFGNRIEFMQSGDGFSER